MEPAIQDRMGSISLQDVEACLAHARAAVDTGDPARAAVAHSLNLSAADACALSLADEEHARVMQPLQARAASLDSVHADLWGRLRHVETQQRSTAAEMATVNRQHETFTPNFRPSSRQPPPAGAATRPAAPAASVTFSVPAAQQRRPTPAPAPLQHQAPAQPSLPATSTVLTAPSTALATGNTMPPPPPPAARVPFTTAASWSVVAARNRRQPPPTPHDDRYMDLRVSKLMFHNKLFPADLRKPIKELASHINAAFRALHGDKCHLRFAIQLATQDGTPLCDYLVDDIFRLRDLLDRAYATPAGAEWVREALRQAAASRRPTWTTSSGRDKSFFAGPRRRDEPSSGRDNSKKTTLTETSDSDDRQPRHQGHHRPDNRKG
ncbi:unnamed protein product [Ascophyllum nodosum]